MKLLLIFYSLHTSVCLEGITILFMKYSSCLWPYFSLFISTNSTKNRPLSLFVIHFPKKEKEKLGWGMGGVLEDQVFFLVELDDLSLIRKAAFERLLHAYTKLREICSKV